MNWQATATPSELTIVRNAVASTLKRYETEPTVANKKNLDAARAGLDEAVARMWAVYVPEDSRFKTLLEVVGYLKGKGYKIAKSKIYQDRKNNQIRVQADGSVLKRDADAYSKTLQLLGDPLKGLEASQLKKSELEMARLEKQNQLLDYEIGVKEGLYVSRPEAEMAAASNITVIEANIKNMHVSHALGWIDLVGGDHNRVGDLIEAMENKLNEMFNQLAKTGQFHVVFEEQN